MSLRNTIAHNTLIQIGSKGVGTILGIGTIAIMTRYLGQEQYGWYTTVISFLQYFGILIDFGFQLVLAHMLGSYPEKEKEIVQNVLTLRVVTAVVIFALAPIVGWFFPYPPLVKVGITLTALSFIATTINQTFLGLFQKNLTMYIPALAEIVGRGILFGLTVLAAIQDTGFLFILLAITLSSIINLGIVLVQVHRFVPLRFGWNLILIRKILEKSWPIALGIIFNLVYLRTDIILLSVLRSQEEVGLYGASYRVLDISLTLPLLFMGLILPLMSAAWVENNKKRLHHLIQESFNVLSLIALPMMIGGWLVSKPLMRWIAGRAFEESGVILRILVIALGVTFITSLFGYLIVAIDAQKKSLWIYGGVACMSIPLYLYSIRTYGMYGAAVGTVITEGIAGIGLLYLSRRLVSFHLTFQTFGKALCASGAMIPVAYLLPSTTHASLEIILLSMVYLLCIIALRTFPRGMIREIVYRKP